MSLLSAFMPLVSFYTPWKDKKTRGFFMFRWGIYRERPVAWNGLICFITFLKHCKLGCEKSLKRFWNSLAWCNVLFRGLRKTFLKYWKIALKQLWLQLVNNLSIADFEEVLNHRETRGVLRTPPNIYDE